MRLDALQRAETARVSQDTAALRSPCSSCRPEQPLPALHSPGQTALSARRWYESSELLPSCSCIATSWGAGSGTSWGRAGRDQRPKTGRGEEDAGLSHKATAGASSESCSQQKLDVNTSLTAPSPHQ